MNADQTGNPLLRNHSNENAIESATTLPDFKSIAAKHFLPAVETLIVQCEQKIEDILSKGYSPTWKNLLLPIEEELDKLDQAWSVISHLNAVKNTDEIREAYSACLPGLTEFSTRLGQHKQLFKAVNEIKKSEEFEQLTPEKKKVVNNKIRDFKLAGVDLVEEKQKQFAELNKELAQLTTKFSDNVLDATEAFTKHIHSEEELKGVPQTVVDQAAVIAKEKSLEGFVLTLHMPCYLPVMKYCENAALREELYRAFTTRASELGPNANEYDNTALIDSILEKRYRIASIIGFENYAELSIQTKMAESTQQVIDFLNDLSKKSLDYARKEYIDLESYAKDNLGFDSLKPWDILFVTEKLREQKYALSQEELRPYFSAENVLQGMFDIVKRLYGIVIRTASAPSLWHEDAQYYEIFNEQGELQAGFYLDLFARQGKRGGAWMADCHSRRIKSNGELQLPIAFLNCNFTPPNGDQPSLLTHDEVTTLFHEFGHGLHHMLTQIDTSSVSGINGVAWDAVELPSQFMENWCWEEKGLALIARHYKTGEALPEELLAKMLAAKNFQSAMQMMRQLEFALFDFILHSQYGSENFVSVKRTLGEVRAKVSVYEVPEFNRFENGFTHIFAGGYAAGYYSYKWAEVLSSDAFSLFEEKGLFDKETGSKFLKEILSQGGSKEPAELFKNFRGREPKIDALLRHSGIAA